MNDAATVIARLLLQPHPDGGHYRETVRLPALTAGGRSPMTAILYLLAAARLAAAVVSAVAKQIARRMIA